MAIFGVVKQMMFTAMATRCQELETPGERAREQENRWDYSDRGERPRAFNNRECFII